jgi:hypothetical protein
MKVYDNNLRSWYAVMIGAAVFLALSSGLPTPSAAQYQQPSTGAAPPNENQTSTSAANATGTANATSAPNATLTEFVSNIEQIRGHLDQAVINKKAGDNNLTLAHTLHPIEEVYASIEGPLAKQNSTLNQTVSAALQNLSSSATNATAQAFEGQTVNTNMLLNNSVQAVVAPEELNNTAFNASVSARLLDIAGHEYEEAVANGTVKAMVEYQDAQAFINRAEVVFNATSDKIDPAKVHEVEEVNTFFADLNNTVTSKGDPETATTTINGIIHELAEITSLAEDQLISAEAGAEEEQDPVAIINKIKSMLNQVLSAYKSQNYPEAESIAIEAYLENYEFIEEPIAQHDQQLMEQTEIMLREELRQMIKDKAPVEQIQQHIDKINANLDKAATLLQQ